MPQMIAKNKRILFIITQSEMGGAQRFLYNFLSNIQDHHEIMVATGSDGGNELAEKLKTINIAVMTLKFLKREISPVNDIRACFEIKNLIEDFQPNDLFLLSSKAGFIGSLVSRFKIQNSKFKILYRIGGWSFNDPGPSWKKNLWKRLERLSAGWKDIIIVNNRHDLDQAEKLKIKPREKLILIHNGVDTYKMGFLSKEEARMKLFEKISRYSGNLPAGRQEFFQAKTIVGTIANFYPAKGLEVLIEVAEHFKHNGVVFLIIGDGPERPRIEAMIKERDLEHSVFLLGQMPDAKKYLPAFDMFVLPSLKEGFPWVLIEAMAARLPVIATSVGAVPEILENGRNGFIVEPNRPEQIAAKIKEIASSERLGQELSIQAHQTVLFNFSEDKMVRETEALL